MKKKEKNKKGRKKSNLKIVCPLLSIDIPLILSSCALYFLINFPDKLKRKINPEIVPIIKAFSSKVDEVIISFSQISEKFP